MARTKKPDSSVLFTPREAPAADDAPPPATPETDATPMASSASESASADPNQAQPQAEASEPSSAAEEPARPSWFRTLNDGRIYQDGAVVTVAAGSCVSDVTHNLLALDNAGIRTVPIDAPVLARDAYGEVSS